MYEDLIRGRGGGDLIKLLILPQDSKLYKLVRKGLHSQSPSGNSLSICTQQKGNELHGRRRSKDGKGKKREGEKEGGDSR